MSKKHKKVFKLIIEESEETDTEKTDDELLQELAGILSDTYIKQQENAASKEGDPASLLQ